VKRTWIFVICLFLAVFFIPSARYSVQAQNEPVAQNLLNAGLPIEGSVLVEAHRLLASHGSFPHWPLKSFIRGEDVPDDEAPAVVAHLIPCESHDVSVKHLDSNHAFSYGVLQIQSSTWAEFSRQSGLSGDPMRSPDAVQMGLWAVEHGYLWRWSCAKLTGLIH